MPAIPIRSVVAAFFNRSRMNLVETTLLLMVSSMAEIGGGTLRRRNQLLGAIVFACVMLASGVSPIVTEQVDHE